MLLLISGLAMAAEPAPPPIINGGDATEDDYGMAGGMLMDATVTLDYFGTFELRAFICSSTLIAPDVVLLAAHCVDEYALTYGIGTVDEQEIRWTRQADLSAWDGSSTPDWPADAVAAWDWVVPDEWDLFSLQTGLAKNYDVALLFLEEPITDAPLSYLITAEEASQIEVGLDVTVVGWGQQTATSTFEPIPAGTYGYKQMGLSFINEVSDYELQIGGVEEDVRKCHGDSGGPTFLEIETDSTVSFRQIGVTSHAYDETDCFEVGGVDTRVDYYLDWIDAEMRARCDDGTRAWCDVPGILPPPTGDDTGGTDPGGDDTGGAGTGGTDSGGTDSGGTDAGGTDTGAAGGGSGGELDGDAKGCGCASTSGGGVPAGVWILGLVGAAVLRRRRALS